MTSFTFLREVIVHPFSLDPVGHTLEDTGGGLAHTQPTQT